MRRWSGIAVLFTEGDDVPLRVSTSPSKHRNLSTFLFITAEYNLLRIKRACYMLMQDKHTYLKRGVDDQRERSDFASVGLQGGG